MHAKAYSSPTLRLSLRLRRLRLFFIHFQRILPFFFHFLGREPKGFTQKIQNLDNKNILYIFKRMIVKPAKNIFYIFYRCL
jgi:hypothetical protein